jgi:hypothetical protein
VNVEALSWGWAIIVGLVMVVTSRRLARTQAQKWVSSRVMPQRFAPRLEMGYQWFLIVISVGLICYAGMRVWAVIGSR